MITDRVIASYRFYKIAAIVVVPVCGRSKDIGIPNFDQIFQSTADILLLPVSKNKLPPY